MPALSAAGSARRTSTRTDCPPARSAATSARPRKPAAPVTSASTGASGTMRAASSSRRSRSACAHTVSISATWRRPSSALIGGVVPSCSACANACAPCWMPGEGRSRPVAKRSTFHGTRTTSRRALVKAVSTMPMNFGPGSTRLIRQICRKRSASMMPRVPCTMMRFCIGRMFHDSSSRPTPSAHCARASHSSNFRLVLRPLER